MKYKYLITLALMLALLPVVIADADEILKLEQDAVKGLYDTSKAAADYADGLDPMIGGKWLTKGADNSNDVLKKKIGILEVALGAVNEILSTNEYSSDEKLGLKQTYGQANNAKTRLEDMIAELNEVLAKSENGEVKEDGEIDGSGWFNDDKFDNDKFKTKLFEKKKGAVDEDTMFDWDGNSKFMWIALAILLIVFNKKLFRLGGWSRRKGGNVKIARRTLKHSDEDLLKKLEKVNKELGKVKDKHFPSTTFADNDPRLTPIKEVMLAFMHSGESQVTIKQFKIKIDKTNYSKDLKKSLIKVAEKMEDVREHLQKREKKREKEMAKLRNYTTKSPAVDNTPSKQPESIEEASPPEEEQDE